MTTKPKPLAGMSEAEIIEATVGALKVFGLLPSVGLSARHAAALVDSHRRLEEKVEELEGVNKTLDLENRLHVVQVQKLYEPQLKDLQAQLDRANEKVTELELREAALFGKQEGIEPCKDCGITPEVVAERVSAQFQYRKEWEAKAVELEEQLDRANARVSELEGEREGMTREEHCEHDQREHGDKPCRQCHTCCLYYRQREADCDVEISKLRRELANALKPPTPRPMETAMGKPGARILALWSADNEWKITVWRAGKWVECSCPNAPPQIGSHPIKWLPLPDTTGAPPPKYTITAGVARVDGEDYDRCQRCGWPIGESVSKGCVAGNCSQRPMAEPMRYPDTTGAGG